MQPLAISILKKRKTLGALALATALGGFAAPQARADMTTCWVTQKGTSRMKPMECDHTIRTDASGTRWNQLVWAHNGMGVRIALYGTNGKPTSGVMTMLDGSNRVRTSAWTDSDGDTRVRFGDFSIAFRPSDNPTIASLDSGSGSGSGGTISASYRPRNVEVEELLQGF